MRSQAHTEPVRESTSKNLLALGLETAEIANNTLLAVNDQEEHLKKSHRQLAQMEDNLDQGDRLLRSIGSVWGQISNYFRPEESGVHVSAFDAEEAKRNQKLDKEIQKIEQDYQRTKDQRANSAPPLRKVSNDPVLAEKYKIMEDQDKDLDAFLDTLTEIKLNAKKMNALLDSSNARLEDMQTRSERTDSRVVHQTKLATKYAK